MATPLQGASFELRDSSGTVLRSGISDINGIVDLGNVSPGTYTLVETSAPDGFVLGGPYTVIVTGDGEITVNGISLADFIAEDYPYPNITFIKTNPESGRLAGAVFQLDDNSGTVRRSTSTIDGNVVFYSVPPGQYSLTEITAPFGYVADPDTYTVVIDMYGQVTVNGNPIAAFTAVNQDGPALTFVKTDNTPQSPVPTIDPVRTGLTPVTGSGVAGSTITVTWPDGTTADVIVGGNNTWTATPATALVVGDEITAVQTTPGMLPSDPVTATVEATSEQPVINDIFEGLDPVTGTGIAGSTVTVTWPDGTTSDGTVEAGGTWTVTPSTALVFGQTVSAVQTTAGMLPSLSVDEPVQAYSPVPTINQVVEGDATVGGTGLAGATIRITWPDASNSTTTVGPSGTWVATPPASLTESETITANQTVTGKIVSADVSTVVLGISDPPVINTILEGDTQISGTGIADSVITVIWPDGINSTVSAVDSGGTWTATAPEELLFGEIVTATQTSTGRIESIPTAATVTAVSETPVLGYIEYNYTTLSGTGVAGSTITVTWPDGTTTSTATVNPDDSWSVPVPVTLVPGQIIYGVQLTTGMLVSARGQTTVYNIPT